MREIGPVFTPAPAREAAIRALAEGEPHPILNRSAPVETNRTLKAFIKDTYAPHFKAHHRSAKNLDNLVAFGDRCEKRLREIALEDLTAWRNVRRRDGTKLATINRNINALIALDCGGAGGATSRSSGVEA